MATTFTVITRTLHPLEDVFAISLDIDQHSRSFASARSEAIDGVMTGTIKLGEAVTWRSRHFGLWTRLTTRIDAMDRPNSFSDVQERGPFSEYRHEHVFVRQGEATWILDHVTVGVPVLGRLVERSIVMPHLRKLIRARYRHLFSVLDERAAVRERLKGPQAQESADSAS